MKLTREGTGAFRRNFFLKFLFSPPPPPPPPPGIRPVLAFMTARNGMHPMRNRKTPNVAHGDTPWGFDRTARKG